MPVLKPFWKVIWGRWATVTVLPTSVHVYDTSEHWTMSMMKKSEVWTRHAHLLWNTDLISLVTLPYRTEYGSVSHLSCPLSIYPYPLPSNLPHAYVGLSGCNLANDPLFSILYPTLATTLLAQHPLWTATDTQRCDVTGFKLRPERGFGEDGYCPKYTCI